MSARKTTKAKSRIYWRAQGGERRAYADFRDLGYARVALVAPGDTRATTDPLVAEHLAAEKLKELMTEKRDKAFDRKPVTKLSDYVAYHLIQKAKSGKFSETWLGTSEHMLGVAIEHFGADRDLSNISVTDVQEYANWLATRPTKRKAGTLGPGAVRHHLNVLSSLYDRAQSEEKVKLGYNPVARMTDKPEGQPKEAKWLEVHEAALCWNPRARSSRSGKT
jgi:hypothetical protein